MVRSKIQRMDPQFQQMPPKRLTLGSIRRIVWAVCQGFVDSFKFHDVLSHDTKRATERSLRSSSSDGGSGSLAKRRALQRREKAESGHSGQEESPRILERTLKCCLLNGCVFWASIVLFDHVILPLVEFLIHSFMGAEAATWLWKTVFPVLSVTFATLWVLPFYLLSKFVNAIWFADIADTAFRNSGPGERPRMMNTLTIAIADTIFSIIVETIFLFQAKIFTLILTPFPLLGQITNFVHLCLLHSLYCFEYKWFNQGLELHKRLSFIENNWPYFMGFGLPLAATTNYPENIVVSGCVFAILFPLFIVSGNCAQVLTTVDEEIKLPIFKPTIDISNKIFTKVFKDRDDKDTRRR